MQLAEAHHKVSPPNSPSMAPITIILLFFLLTRPLLNAFPACFDGFQGEENFSLFDIESFLPAAMAAATVIDVDDYGAEGGSADDTTAFERAWEAACSSTRPVTLMVRKNATYHLRPITFSGPCESDVSVMIEGTIEASTDISDWKGKNRRLWILFSNIENLRVGGGGVVNGNGNIWWQKSCKIDKSQPCKDAPTALTFRSCNGLTVQNLSLKDSPQIHIKFDSCNNVTATALNIAAPEKSPNTDGIHVTGTQIMQITDCIIGTGDDCISIVSGSQGVMASNISCGPGHGISIGSLGEKNSKAQVSDVTVDTAQLNGTTNGVRIKTWQGGRGYAKNIVFQNIDMDDVQNPIIIDQSYCDKKTKCKQQKSAVQISNVHYKNIKGSSASKIAINFNCSKNFPCKRIILEDINLVLSGEDTDDTQSFCRNVEWTRKGSVIPPPCIPSIKSDADEYGALVYRI